MVDELSFVRTFVPDVLWQSTLLLVAGLLLARLWGRHSARAHAVLALTLFAAIAAPLTSQLVRQRGWGMLEPDRALVAAAEASPNTNSHASAKVEVPSTQLPPDQFLPPRNEDQFTQQSPEPMKLADTPPPIVMAPVTHQASARTIGPPAKPSSLVPFAWGLLALAWICASLVFVVRLLRGVWAGTRLLRSAERCHSPSVSASLAGAVDRLGLGALRIDVYESPSVHCPLIWCWGRRPKLLLPVDAVCQWTTDEWTPIACHELAHWKRRDHWTALGAEVICCLLPWQPLAWLVKRRLEQASEQACDDWTLAAGHSATDYAETLLNLVAQNEPPLVLAALGRRSGLAARIHHILTSGVPRPKLGRTFALIMLGLAVMGVGGTALCQRGIARADSAPPDAAKPDAAKPDTASAATESKPAEPAAPPNGKEPAKKDLASKDSAAPRVVSGRVLKPDGQPAADVAVIWEGTERYRRGGLNENTQPPRLRFAHVKTDADGRFRCEANINGVEPMYTQLVIVAAGFGLRSRAIDMAKLDEPLDISLENTIPIQGTIFTPNGEPVVGAKVAIQSMGRYAESKDKDGKSAKSPQAWHLSLGVREVSTGEHPDYWPAPVLTDAQGQFRIETVMSQTAHAQLTISAKDFAAVRVGVSDPAAPRYANAIWRDATFTLVLEQPYLFEGQFLDEKTGAGIPGVQLTVMPMSNERGGNRLDQAEVTSDAEGRYTFRMGASDSYWTQVKPPLGYPGVNQSLSLKELERMAIKPHHIRTPIKLRAGKVLRGKVVDQATGEPVAGADVAYKKLRGRKFGLNGNFLPVKTAADGSFEVTGADGKGFLIVDAPDRGFYRVRLDDSRLFNNRQGFFPHGYLEIDAPAEGPGETYTISLHRGSPLIARVVDPAGKPVAKLVSATPDQEIEGVFQSNLCQNGELRIDAVQPGQTVRVFLYSADAKAGKMTEIVAPADGQPIEIKLEPCATIRGRYVYEGGMGVPEVTNFPHFRTDPNKGFEGDQIFDLPFYDNFTQDRSPKHVSDEDGNFVLDNIVPGAFIYLSLNYRFDDNKGYRAVGTLDPGEVKDLGDLVIHPN